MAQRIKDWDLGWELISIDAGNHEVLGTLDYGRTFVSMIVFESRFGVTDHFPCQDGDYLIFTHDENFDDYYVESEDDILDRLDE
jgi:hypothetical protein